MKRKRRASLKTLTPREQALKTKKHKLQRWQIYPMVIVGSLAFIGVVMIIILSRNLPSLTELEQIDPWLVTRIYSADGKVLKELYQQNRIEVPFERMPDNLIQAVVATEDRKFWNHWGVDVIRSAKLVFLNLISMEIQGGGSTLTQQLARKLYLSPKKILIRKLREQLTALQIERTYSKKEIIEMYLNQMEYGRGAHGVQAASLAYFGKNVEDLEIQESALIAGMLQLPYGYYNPDRNAEAAKKRRNVVLFAMHDYGYLNRAQYDSLSLLDIGVIPREREETAIAPYFCEYVRRQMWDKYGPGLLTNGYSIYTSLDSRIQEYAELAVNEFLPGLEQKIHNKMIKNKMVLQWVNPPLTTNAEINAFLADSAKVDSVLEARATVQTALVAVEPGTGHILAMIGGRDFNKWKFNRAIQATRQPGSTFKPLMYTAAIDNGYPPWYELYNQPIVITQVDGTRWSPSNYDGSTGGLTTLREGLRRSLNLVSVQLIQKVPPQRVVSYAKRFGLSTTIHPYDAIALGADVVIPIEMVSAFSVFANDGVRVEPVAVLRVEDKNGNVIYENVPRHHEVISKETAYIMTDMLQTAINRGTGQSSRTIYDFRRPAGGKTGTTNDERNAWFIGFTPQIAAGVWVGFDDQRIRLGDRRTGANTALPIWAPFMKMVYDSLQWPYADFKMPENVQRIKLCAKTKKIARESCPEIWDEIYFRNRLPIDTCDVHVAPSRRRDSNKKKSQYLF